MLAKRIMTGVIGGAVAIFAIYEGDWLYFGMILILALMGWREFVQLGSHLQAKLTARCGFVWIFLIFCSMWFLYMKMAFFLGVVMFLWLLLRTVIFHTNVKPVDSAYSLYGLLYITVGFLSLLMLRHGQMDTALTGYFRTVLMEPACFVVFLMVLSTWASDTFAYIVGRIFGRVKLCPAISPGKTIEGLIGGCVGTIITAVAFSAVFTFSLFQGAFIGFLVAVLAPLGDLVESILKRVCQVKDSGNFLPGHGGILDRFDSLLFVAPAVYAYLVCITG